MSQPSHMTNRQYIVCILAHNEEAVIADTVQSLLLQQVEPEALLAIYVFTNGCTDKTNEIVADVAKRDARVCLVALPEKGKVYAIRESIAYFKRLHDQSPNFDRVFYIDADVTFPDQETLAKLSRALDASHDLYLVSSYPLAETGFDGNGWYLSRLAEARQELQQHFRYNIVRGRCYVIRYEALVRVDYPPETLSDDMYLELRLNGHYLMDYSILTATKLKGSLEKEIRRDLFTLIAREQLYDWHRKRQITELDPETRRREWSLFFPQPWKLLRHLLGRGALGALAVMAMWLPIYRFNERKARRIFRESQAKRTNLLDYWSTQR